MNSDDNSFSGTWAGMHRVPVRAIFEPAASRTSLSLLAVMCALLAFVPAAAMDVDPEFPAADGLLTAVRARFPQEPVGIQGQLIVRSPRYSERIRLNVDVLLDWGASPTISSYTVRDYFGAPLDRLTVHRGDASDAAYTFASGPDLTNSALPDLASPIRGTDVSWLDLSLAYLWWPGGETVGTDTVSGQDCYIVNLPAPQDEQAQYTGVKLWISAKSMMMLRAEAYDAAGSVVRQVALKSFKKIDDQWVARRIDVTSHPSGRRTRLLVRSVAAVGGSETPGEDAAGDGD